MGSTYSQHLSNDIGLFLLSGVVVVMLGNIWVSNMRDLFDTWKCHSNSSSSHLPVTNPKSDLQAAAQCRDPQTLAEYFLLSIFVSVALYFMIVGYARFLNKYDSPVDQAGGNNPGNAFSMPIPPR